MDTESALVEALNRTLFGWLAAGYSPQPLLLIAAHLIAEYSVDVVPLVLLAVWFRRPSCRDSAVAAAIAGGLALAASEVIAAITAHPRPFMVGLSPMYVPHDVEGSFPSAHTSLMLAVAATLLRVQGTRAGGASLAGLALLTGWARVYLGLHFPMDIAGSVAVAALTSAPLRGDYRWVAWLRRQVERVVPFGTRATPAITGKGSAERETVGK